MKTVAAWLTFWNDVDPCIEDEYNEWHGGEHVPQRLTVPGILGALRYRAQYDNQVRYLTWYSLERIDVLGSAPYLDLLANPTPWTRRMRPFLRNTQRYACWTRLANVDRPGPRVRPILIGGRGSEALREAWELPVLLGEVAQEVKPLPWAAHESADTREPVRWVRLETLADPFPGTYRLIQDFCN